MMNDMNLADKLYKPTNYWSFYERLFLSELKKKGLHDFRRRKNSVLGSFAANDIFLQSEPQYNYNDRIKIKGFKSFVRILLKVINFFGVSLRLNIPEDEIVKYFFNYTKNKFDSKSINIFKCPTSRFGNPEDIMNKNNTYWSLRHLQYCSMFIDTVDNIKYNRDMVFCELGSGLGRNIEVMAQLYPKATFIIFDIPPQLYVANQYLSSVFNKRVIGYDKAINLNKIENNNSIKGKIIILPTWAFPDWANLKIDIFWNSASFQEMEPENVYNYLNLAIKMKPNYIYLNALPDGTAWKGVKNLGGAMKSPDSLVYLDSLKDKYFLENDYFTDYFMRDKKYVSYIFKRI